MIIPKTIHESWHEDLQPLFDDIKMSMVLDTVSKGYYYPKKEDVFKVFRMPMDRIKVVILGQDPYPNGEATGLAFGVRTDKNTPQSLIIIKKEIERTIYPEKEMFSQVNYPDIVNWKTLEHWWKQGVFLLNSALTVEDKKPNSHTLIWQWFTRQIVHIISTKQPSIWMLWGTKAQNYLSYIDHHVIINQDNIDVVIPNNGVLQAPHPVAEAYDPSRTPRFSGCNHFSMCNQILKHQDKGAIVW